jgi:uncharacterized protein (DUF2147 family)
MICIQTQEAHISTFASVILKQELMKKSFLILITLFTSYVSLAQNENQIIGTWQTEAKDGKMEVFKCGDKYCGKLLTGKNIINADGTSKKDINNPDEKLRNRDLVGTTILTNLTFDEDEYDKGEIYNAENGKTYKCYVWIKNDVLHLRGYLGIKAFGETSKWHRISN